MAENTEQLIEQLEEKTIDLITFTSSSTVNNFKALLPPDDFQRLLDEVVIASIGPITTETAIKTGFNVHITAQSHTIPGLCTAILRFFAKNKS